MLGFDVLEMRDHIGGKYSVMSMVDIATRFDMSEVVKPWMQHRTCPFGSPAAIGKVERHGGILKAMVRKVLADTETVGLADFEMLLQECTSTKNQMQRTNGYSASR